VSGFLLDTNVLSEIVRPKPHPGVVGWVDATDESLLYISVLTLGEIRKGVTLLPAGRRRASLESWLDHDLVVRFSGRILTVDAAVADRWGWLSGSGAAKRSPLPVIDGLLAATALHHNLTLVTRDSGHSAITGVDVFDPWQT
jgi:predicted nucleic acid-binding protein